MNSPVVSVTVRAVAEAQVADEFDHTHVPPVTAVYSSKIMLKLESETGTPFAFKIRP